MSEEQQEEYKRGRKVHLDNCHYYGNDNTFSCDVNTILTHGITERPVITISARMFPITLPDSWTTPA